MEKESEGREGEDRRCNGVARETGIEKASEFQENHKQECHENEAKWWDR
jgi:hypothetical protein